MQGAPLIGITAHLKDNSATLGNGYYRAVQVAGGVPVIIPPFTTREQCDAILDSVDGILFSGGPDIQPEYFGQEPHSSVSVNAERDLSEMMLAHAAVERCMPVLGICRGIQLLTVAMGGTLYQDISLFPSNGNTVGHKPVPPCDDDVWHNISVDGNSIIGSLLGTNRLTVNSYHHQIVDKLPAELKPVAWTDDGAVEAVESSLRTLIAVQWHPERMFLKGNDLCMPLFRWLVEKSANYAGLREFHSKHIILDSHCDTPMLFQTGTEFANAESEALVTLPGMKAGGLGTSFMVAYIPQKERSQEGLAQATSKAEHILDLIENQVGNNKESVVLANTPAQIRAAISMGKKVIVRGIENGYALGKDLSLVGHFKRRGVTYITLCHNGDNDICDSAKGNSEHNGLSAFGRQVVAEMNRLGIMVDLSHASEKSFWDALECSRAPIFCSHSSCRALCDHRRNLSDQQIAALAKSGGVMQICIYGGFLENDESAANVHSAVRHIMHAIDIAGIDHVGIGTDMDGGGGVPGLENVCSIMNLTRLLGEEGLDDSHLAKLWGENLLDYFDRVNLLAE